MVASIDMDTAQRQGSYRKDVQILRLVSGEDLKTKYGFVLPGCQSFKEYNAHGEKLKEIVHAMKKTQSTNSIINASTRISLAMTYYRSALALSDVLMASMTQVHSWFGIDTDKRMETGHVVQLGGGQVSSQNPHKRKRKHAAIRGGGPMSWVAKAKGMFATLKSVLGFEQGVNEGLRELQAQAEQANANSGGNTTVDRKLLPPLPSINHMLGTVSAWDAARFRVVDDHSREAFVIQKLYQPFKPRMQCILDVGLAGVSNPFQKVVEDWIGATASQDASTDFEVLWRIPTPNVPDMGVNSDYLYKKIHVNMSSGGLDMNGPQTQAAIMKVSTHLEGIMTVFASSLNKLSGDGRQGRDDKIAMDNVLEQCRTLAVTESVMPTDIQTRRLLEENLNGFLNRAVAYMLANVDPSNPAMRMAYIIHIVDIVLRMVMPSGDVKYNANTFEWNFKVQNYQAKDFLRVKGLQDAFDQELQKKFDNPDDGFLAHSVFANALAKLNRLDIAVQSKSQPISSYAHVTMFLAAMDRVLAKLGSVIFTDQRGTTRIVFATAIDKESVSIAYNIRFLTAWFLHHTFLGVT
jgi:hypothetical protein